MLNRAKSQRLRRDDTVWPQENDQERVVTNKPAPVPHFLCRAQEAQNRPAPGSEPARRKPDNQNDADAPTARHWMNGDAGAPADNSPPMKPGKKKFSPVSPHLHRMMARRPAEPPQHRIEMPAWVQDTQVADRQGIAKGLAIAGCLVLASAVGLTVTAMEFKGAKRELPAVWNKSLAAILPTFETKQRPEMKRLPVIGEPKEETTAALPKPPGSKTGKIGSVKLTVADASGTAQSPIALPVKAEAGKNEPPIAVRLTGLPAAATLSAGTKNADETWLVQPADLAGLHVTLPQEPAAPVKVTVAAVETETGELAAPMQEMMITFDTPSNANLAGATPADAAPAKSVMIEPTALPAANSQNFSSEAALRVETSGNTAALAMRTRGDETLALGDVTGARGFYQMAVKMGDVASYARIGRTFDPVVYEAVGVHGLKPDAGMAERWYKHAISEGDASAREDLKRLSQRLQ